MAGKSIQKRQQKNRGRKDKAVVNVDQRATLCFSAIHFSVIAFLCALPQ